jgi:hypothetical protein
MAGAAAARAPGSPAALSVTASRAARGVLTRPRAGSVAPVDAIAGLEEHSRIDERLENRLARDFVDGEARLGAGDGQHQGRGVEKRSLDAHDEVFEVPPPGVWRSMS